MILELRNIFKTYQQSKLEVPVLKNVSLSVREGEYVAIMGPSGSGKTTLMNIIGCLDNPTSGMYLLEGEDLSQQSDAKMSEVRLRSIGFVFQSFYLLSRQSAIENVALPLLYAGVHRKERLEMARKSLERVGLGDRVDFKPTQLSGGQCQRVAIARAIVNSPKILLADEPTGALDTQSGEQIMEIFQKLNNEGVTIVMITHEPEIAAHAQRTLHIRDGRLLDEHGKFLAPETLPERETAPSETPAEGASFARALPPRETDLPEDVIPAAEFLAASKSAPVKPVKEEAPRFEAETEPQWEAEIAAAIESELEPEGQLELESEPQPEPQPEPEVRQPVREVIPVELDFARDLGADRESVPEPAPVKEEVLEHEVEVASAIELESEEQAESEPQPESEVRQPVREVIPVELDFARDLGADRESVPEPAPVKEEAPEHEVEVASAIELEPEEQAEPEPEPQPEPAGFVDDELAALLEQPPLDAEVNESGEVVFDISAIPVEDILEPPELVTRPAGEGAAEQLAFDIWGAPEEAEETDEAKEASKLQNEEEKDFTEASAASGEPDEPEEEVPQGGFGAPLKLDVDLTQVLQAPTDGGFRRPIKVELDGLGLESSPSSAPEEERR